MEWTGHQGAVGQLHTPNVHIIGVLIRKKKRWDRKLISEEIMAPKAPNLVKLKIPKIQDQGTSSTKNMKKTTQRRTVIQFSKLVIKRKS